MRTTVFLMFLAANAFAASPLIIGGRGGTGLDVSNSSNSAISSVTNNLWGHNFAVGPTIGVRLPMSLSVEGDALYNRRSLGLGLPALGGIVDQYTRAEWWEFPVMLKYSGNGPISPVFGGGVSFQHISNFGSVPSYVFSGRTSADSVGFVGGAGVSSEPALWP